MALMTCYIGSILIVLIENLDMRVASQIKSNAVIRVHIFMNGVKIESNTRKLKVNIFNGA